MLICRYDKEANPSLCTGCTEGCIVRKPAFINEDFEKAVRDMEQSTAKQNGRKVSK